MTDRPATEPRTEAEWTWLNDDYRAGTVFITDDPTGEQGAIAEGLRETVADRIVNAHNAVVRSLAEAAPLTDQRYAAGANAEHRWGAAPRAEGLALTRLDRIMSLRGTLARIADGRGPAREMAQAALDADNLLDDADYRSERAAPRAEGLDRCETCGHLRGEHHARRPWEANANDPRLRCYHSNGGMVADCACREFSRPSDERVPESEEA